MWLIDPDGSRPGKYDVDVHAGQRVQVGDNDTSAQMGSPPAWPPSGPALAAAAEDAMLAVAAPTIATAVLGYLTYRIALRLASETSAHACLAPS
jgi:hypothetical protein